MDRGSPLRFYRIVLRRVAERADFLSHEARGIKPRSRGPRTLRLWDGISVYDDEAWTVEKARQLPQLGSFIATLELPDDAPVRIEKTLSDPHHYTLWADAGMLLSYVIHVTSVEGSQT